MSKRRGASVWEQASGSKRLGAVAMVLSRGRRVMEQQTMERQTTSRLPRLAITMGDPAGIGPEIVAKALHDGRLAERCQVVVIGDFAVMAAAMERAGPRPPPLHEITTGPVDAITHTDGGIALIQAGPALSPVVPGRVEAACGHAAFAAVDTAIALANAGRVDGIVTAPLNKEALSAAGVAYPGHTEMLADRADGAGDVAMMLANDELRVVLVTIHLALRDAIAAITPDSVLRTIRLADTGARAFGVDCPRVAVAGLNPHAGEGGLFGREDIEIIAPAIAVARAEGIDASGPWPGDTVFMQARDTPARPGRFDVVVAQYHDQGLIPVKYLGVEHGVNVTLGLPFVRTSPDHGTAFDIAGRGIADPASMVTAIDTAIQLVNAQSMRHHLATA